MFGDVVYHIDVNSAFLSWTAVYIKEHLRKNTDIRLIPAVIGGSIEHRRGIILAKSIPAKKYNIHTGEAIPTALEKCPNLLVLPPYYDLYDRCSANFIWILRQYSAVVEQYSVDEAFVDMSKTRLLYSDPVRTAYEIKDRIREELGFTVNIGVSSNKLLAKMASEFEKPNKVHTLFPDEIEAKLWPLPVSELFFVGRATAKKLLKLGIYTIGDLAHSDAALLRSHLKKQGEVIWDFANGRDFSSVDPEPIPNKGYGNSTTIPFDVNSREVAKIVLLSLTETVTARLRRDRTKIRVVSVGIKDHEFRYASHQKVLTNQTNITDEIHRVACELFDELWDGVPIRHLGIHTSMVSRDSSFRQMDLFDSMDYEKLEKLDAAVDRIRKRYGKEAIQRGCFINTPLDSMAGGISKEKKVADYSKCVF